ncbi:hypothetical protein ILUMI_05183 [Ignelater luminosus]|uniref:Uncharacterized protein n=1 Tax=Ignelater luminosus TaxID=2038154 RepID=A0A8K0D878_IGNLU|nr:hypothetical protein ILUMI_05183 [Ignelater luminosus]
MGFSAIPFIVFTVLWGGVGIALPFVVPKGPNRGLNNPGYSNANSCNLLAFLVMLLYGPNEPLNWSKNGKKDYSHNGKGMGKFEEVAYG